MATIELKNPGTGQNWKNAIRQYKEDRDPRSPMFDFKKRTLVHFAADPDEVHMTTRLAGEKTFFLPFNRGSHPGQIVCGSGNPPHPSGYRTGYFWEEVLASSSFMDILESFVFLEKKEEKVEDGKGGHRWVTKETMIFPRYHQLDAVRNLISTSRTEGPGRNYLIQHSAGSGKTNSISWLSHRLASLHDNLDQKVFDCVVVITDRQVLDRQLDRLNQVMQSRGRQPNLSFFAFTATPKGKTLELFGRKGSSGLPEAFHLYSMRQAIEEGFILDVVRNYTTYSTYYRLVRQLRMTQTFPRRRRHELWLNS